jgi:hypothetical protein
MIRESQDYKAVAVFRLLHRADDRNANARDVALDQLYCSVRGPAQGFVPKAECADKLLEAVDAVLRGETFFDTEPSPCMGLSE